MKKLYNSRPTTPRNMEPYMPDTCPPAQPALPVRLASLESRYDRYGYPVLDTADGGTFASTGWCGLKQRVSGSTRLDPTTCHTGMA